MVRGVGDAGPTRRLRGSAEPHPAPRGGGAPPLPQGLPARLHDSRRAGRDRRPSSDVGWKVDRRALPLPVGHRSSGRRRCPRGRPTSSQRSSGSTRSGRTSSHGATSGRTTTSSTSVGTRSSRCGSWPRSRRPSARSSLLSALIRAPTLERLVALIEERSPAPPSRIVGLNEMGTLSPGLPRDPVRRGRPHVPRAVAGPRSAQPVYSLQPPDIVGERFGATIEAAAAEMVDAIEQVQPRGPYNIAGYCIGGLIAFEVATQLQIRGRDVAFVGLLDSVRHGSTRARTRASFAATKDGAVPGARGEGIATLAAVRARVARALRNMSRNALLRATLELCRRTGIPQPKYLRDDKDLEFLIAGLHKPRRFKGSSVLFASAAPRVHDRRTEDWGWAGLSTGGFRRITVPGNHLAMLHPPDVQVLGEMIATSIDDAAADRLGLGGTVDKRA